MRSVELRELMLITIQVRPIVDLGGGRRYVAFDGGTFEGRDGLSGTVLEGGVDWQTVRADGVLEIDAHYTLQTEATRRSRSCLRASARPPSPSRPVAAGRPGRPGRVLLPHAGPALDRGARLSRLNDLIAVSTGDRDRNTVRIHVHEVL